MVKRTAFVAVLAGSLFGLLAPTSVVSSWAGASSSPADQAETAQLNREILKNNSAADDHYALLNKQYLEQRAEYDRQQGQYQTQLTGYAARDAQYDEQKKQYDLLRERYQRRLKGN